LEIAKNKKKVTKQIVIEQSRVIDAKGGKGREQREE
jgi:hypothetical protein